MGTCCTQSARSRPEMAAGAIASPPAAAGSSVLVHLQSPNLSGTPSRPPKPRLLWRGSLLLHDGTALPGVAFVSHSHPLSSGALTPGSKGQLSGSLREAERVFKSEDAAHDDGELESATSSIEDPAIEADLCLALEMVRHRPLRVLGIEQDTKAIQDAQESKIAKGKAEMGSSQASTFVKYEHSVGMRMYIDPKERRTLDFFRRKFCIDEKVRRAAVCRHVPCRDVPPDPTSLQLCMGRQAHAQNVVLVSLEPSQILFGPSPSKDGGETAFASTGSTSWGFGPSSSSSSASELAIFAAPHCDEHPHVLNLVLGRKVVKKHKTRNVLSNSSTVNLGVGSQGLRAKDPFSLRPDDPAPRSEYTLD